MTERILLGEEARKAIKDGVDAISEPVKISLGAKGRTVVIGGGRNYISKDGFSIAKSIQFSDPLKSIGAELIKEVSRNTVKDAGDGTTTSCLLAQAMIVEGFKLLSGGHNGVELKKGMDKAVQVVSASLKEMSIPVEIGSANLKNIATISGNNDETIGENVSQAFIKTGKDGVRSLDDSKIGTTYIETKEGLVFERGYLSPIFINNQETLSCQLEDPYILISEGKISTLKDINGIVQLIAEKKRSIVMIAEDFDGEALYTINTNKIKNGFPICLVKAPGFGDNQKGFLKDIAAVVGANIANDESGLRLDTLKLSDLGTAEKFLATREESTILGGGGEKRDIDERVAFVRKSLELLDANSWFEKQQLEARLAKLTGGIAIIYVGAPGEAERSELKDRYDDAVRACDCAISEGVVVGGGIALIRCIDKLTNLDCSSDDEKAGVKLIQRVLEYPFIQMAENAGLKNKVTISDVLKKGGNYGYNFKTDQWEDLMQSGVVDPLKVVRVSLINAASFASTLLTTEAVIVPEKETQQQFIPPQMR